MDPWQFELDVNQLRQLRNNPQFRNHLQALVQLNEQILAQLRDYDMLNESDKMSTNQVVQNLSAQVGIHTDALRDLINEMNHPIMEDPIHNPRIRDQEQVEEDEDLVDIMYAPENRNLGKRRMSKRLTMKKCMKKHMKWVKKSNRNRGYCRK